MKFLIILILVVAATQAKFVMSPHGLSASMDRNEIEDDIPTAQAAAISETLYIPMARLISCNNGACQAVCKALGYNHGQCVSDTTCRCYN